MHYEYSTVTKTDVENYKNHSLQDFRVRKLNKRFKKTADKTKAVSILLASSIATLPVFSFA